MGLHCVRRCASDAVVLECFESSGLAVAQWRVGARRSGPRWTRSSVEGAAVPLKCSVTSRRVKTVGVRRVGARGEFGQTGAQEITRMWLPHNQLVDTDAQGRPLRRFAPCAPVHGRRSHARYTAG